MRLDKVTAAAERSFEKQHIALQRERYMSTDVVQKVAVDAGYAEKVRQLKNALGGTKGWVLDIGANTCGESEFLTTHGYHIIATDINEIALGISKARCAKFNRKSPRYVACDAHKLALADNSINFVILNEALHHMEFPLQNAPRDIPGLGSRRTHVLVRTLRFQPLSSHLRDPGPIQGNDRAQFQC